MHEQQLRAIHAQACAAVALVDRTITPADDRFWPLYITATLSEPQKELARAVSLIGEAVATLSQGAPITTKWHDDARSLLAADRTTSLPRNRDAFGVDSTERVRAQALEEAAMAVEQHDRGGREWIRGSLWDTLSREAAARIRRLAPHLPEHRMSDAARDVLDERRRQIDIKGFTVDRDDMYDPGFLVSAAAAYLLYAADALHPLAQGSAGYWAHPPEEWSFDRTWWKPVCPRTAMKKAAALVIAEMERIDRDPGDESIHHHTRGGDHA